MSERERVVVTGIAIDSLLGTSYREVEKNLRDGFTDFHVDPWLLARQAKCPIRSAWFKKPAYDGSAYFESHRQVVRNLTEDSVGGLALIKPLLADSGLTAKELESDRTGLAGTGVASYVALADKHNAVFRDDNPKAIRTLGSSAIQKTQLSGLLNAVSLILHTRGVCIPIETACSTGATALSLAKMLIETGRQDRVIVLTIIVPRLIETVFDPLGALSRRADSPNTACRPFCKHRDGVVIGGGRAAVVLESLSAAKKRDANVYCEVAGVAMGSDGFDWTNPSGGGAVECIGAALKDAGMNPDQIGYINAHGTSTPVGDLKEAWAVHEVFKRSVPVASTKSQEGHCTMTGALNELIYGIIMMREGFIAPNINVEQLDPELPPGFDVVLQTRDCKFDAFLKNSFGFGGTNAVLVANKV